MFVPNSSVLPHAHGLAVPCGRDQTMGGDKHRDASSTLCRAIKLLVHGQDAHRRRRLTALFNHATFPSGVRRLAIGADVIYAGAPLPVEQVDVGAIADRIRRYFKPHDDDDDPLCLFVNRYTVILSEWDIWRGDGDLAEELLARSLQGDEAAHCALEIAALVGDSFWATFADTSAHFCTGRAPASACPAWLVDAARGSTGRDQTGEACDAAILRDILAALKREIAIGHTVSRGHPIAATTASDKRLSDANRTTRPVSRVTITAINVAPGFWIARGTGMGVMIGPQLATTRQVSDALAHVRAMGSGAKIRIDANGRRHTIAEPTVLLSDALRQVSVSPGDPAHHDALANMIAFADRDTRERLGSIVAALAGAGIGSGRPSTPCPSLKVPGERGGTVAESIRSLGRLLRATDEARLRARLGPFWDHGGPCGRATMTFGGHRIERDVDGMWRDRVGRIVLWADFVRLAHANRVDIYRDVDSGTSHYRKIASRAAQYGPNRVPDLAYALCRDAMAGAAHATDWLAILSMASSTWKTLYVTVCNVIEWIAGECPLPGEKTWSDPLIDWVLDVPPHKDLVACLGDLYDTFNAKLVDTIKASGGRIIESQYGPWEPPPDATSDMPARRSEENPPCRQRICRTLSWVCVYDSNGALERRATCKSVLIETLNNSPIGIDGRQILSTETMCQLLGKKARGIYALIRALYTVNPLRDLVIHRAQAEMVPILTDAF
ncbi:hypothetical protein pneo_cds_763 [Pandoravirus neocaledonia]|uniref:Uncharacterized protein n=1 Tax=Pandoravirus neocaledonia TaxID=2107708 RepID=A0A2U7UDG5_9VIRU|nr:hypothetical protein pneo_cds_763 [Pandoravirus neocaledonia]AVK76370.1 hypothetical protein pneo_cds_763 [Pandoravirus neocaledonia]